MSFQFSMEPRVSFLTGLMKEIDKGYLQIPRFQRVGVWDWQQQHDLLCSVYEGLPIGAILIWSTHLDNIKSRNTIGPFPVKPLEDTASKTYLMDGLQRLTTLYSMAYHPTGTPKYHQLEDVDNYFVYCDLDADKVEDFFITKTDAVRFKTNIESCQFMPLNLVFDSKELMRFQRNIPENRDNWLERSDDIATAFRNYKIPVVPLESDDQALVTKSFERINSRGSKMSETHMLNALSYSDDFELLEQITSLKDEYLGDYTEWSILDDSLILMSIKLSLNLNPYDKHTDLIAEIIDIQGLRIVFSAIKKAIEFSDSKLNLLSPNAFPYKLQLLGIISAFFNDKPVNEKALVSWFYITTYTSIFGYTARNSLDALNDLKTLLLTGEFKWTASMRPIIQPTGYSIGYRSARVKAWSFTLINRIDNTNSNRDMLQRFNKIKMKTFVLPIEFLKIKKRPGLLFVSNNKKISLFDIGEAEYDSNFINADLIKLAKNNDFEEFALEREKLIYKWEKEEVINPALNHLDFSRLVEFH